MRRFLSYFFIILITFLLQNNVFACSTLIDATPNLLLIVTFSFGFIRGRLDGMLIGFVSGLLMDMGYGSIVGYYALIYMIIGYVNGWIGNLFYRDFLNMPLILCVLSDILYNLYIYIFGFLMHGRLNIPLYVGQVVVPEIVYTAVLTLILYQLFLRLNMRLEELEKRSSKRFV